MTEPAVQNYSDRTKNAQINCNDLGYWNRFIPSICFPYFVFTRHNTSMWLGQHQKVFLIWKLGKSILLFEWLVVQIIL